MPSEYDRNRSPARSARSTRSSTPSTAGPAGRGSGPAPAGCRAPTGTGRSPAPRSARRPAVTAGAPAPRRARRRPPVGRTRPSSIRSVVVLPAPFGPRKPYTSPRAPVRLTPSTASRSPYLLVSPSCHDVCVMTRGSAAGPVARPVRRQAEAPRYADLRTPATPRADVRAPPRPRLGGMGGPTCSGWSSAAVVLVGRAPRRPPRTRAQPRAAAGTCWLAACLPCCRRGVAAVGARAAGACRSPTWARLRRTGRSSSSRWVACLPRRCRCGAGCRGWRPASPAWPWRRPRRAGHHGPRLVGPAGAVSGCRAAVAAATVGSLPRAARRRRAERARRAATEEQLRMAQDLHDGVGHGLAVIAMQAGVALHVLDRDPARARRRWRRSGTRAPEALDALRAELVHAAAGPAAPPRTPRRGLADLAGLVERVAPRRVGGGRAAVGAGGAARGGRGGVPDRAGGADQRAAARRAPRVAVEIDAAEALRLDRHRRRPGAGAGRGRTGGGHGPARDARAGRGAGRPVPGRARRRRRVRRGGGAAAHT